MSAPSSPPPLPLEQRQLPLYVRPDAWRPGAAQWLGLIVVALAAFTADRLTKLAVVDRLQLNETVDLIGPLQLFHVRNQGIAFGVFQGRLGIVAPLTGLAVVWMLHYFSRSGGRHVLGPIALGLLLGGSLGNLWDRALHGYVTDFIYLPHFPKFNFADVFICCGVAMLIVVVTRSDRRESGAAQDVPAP